MKLATLPQLDSIVDGEGLRMVIWTQGCKHNCPECHNPATHDFNAGIEISINDILSYYDNLQDGVTISGGDPFYQSKELFLLLQKLKEKKINVWVYTGFTYEECLASFRDCLDYIDVLVDGLFINGLKDLSLIFVGSSNQRIIDVPRSLEQDKVILYELR